MNYENIGDMYPKSELQRNFGKLQIAKGTINQLNYIKVKEFCTKFCTEKDICIKIQRHLTKWENIFAYHMFHEGLISKI